MTLDQLTVLTSTILYILLAWQMIMMPSRRVCFVRVFLLAVCLLSPARAAPGLGGWFSGNGGSVEACQRCSKETCSNLGLFLGSCVHCPSVPPSCAAAFCLRNPNLCIPIPNPAMGVGTPMEDPSRPDICSVPLFRDLNFEGRDNGDLSINNLNMLDVTFFSQTKGDVNVSPLQRNIGTVRKLAANYLFFRDLVGGSDRRIISSEAVDKFLKDYFHFDVSHPLKGQGMSTNGLFHIMVNWFRIQIYELKGIPTETRDLIYQGKRYSMTVSKLGCQWEKDPNP